MLYHKSSALVLLMLFAAASAASKADVVLEWNEIMLTALADHPPIDETRLAALTQVAVFEAVNATTGYYHPYLGKIDTARAASAEAAAVAAAHAVLRDSVPQRAAELDAARDKSLASIIDGPSKANGIAVGEAAAAAMLAHRADDGSAPPQFYKPVSTERGAWQLTPNCPQQGGVGFHLRNVRPFAIKGIRQFRVPAPPKLRSQEYANAYNEIKRLGGKHSSARPQDRADVARFYAAVRNIQTWNPVARQVAIAQGRSIAENARALALLNMAMSDALVAVFATKYDARFWRPETAIRAGDSDGNHATRGDPEFAPFVGTPCHPSYASAHASSGYAARAVLERIYGCQKQSITLASPALPDVVLSYRQFHEITSDIDDARVFGGIHFRFDQEAGARLGRRIGEYVYERSLQPVYDTQAGELRRGRCER
jgi:hypothetical protein